MCLIIATKPGALPIPEAHIRASWDGGNDHGAGIAYVANGRVCIRKPFWKLKNLLRAYREVQREHGATSPIIVHLRYATHGARNALNTHPHYLCGGRAALAHNGVIHEEILDPAHSDTVNYCRRWLDTFQPADLLDDDFREIIEKDIGAGNKFAVITDDGALVIYNAIQGLWRNGTTWYSNTSYEPPRYHYEPARQAWRDWRDVGECAHNRALPPLIKRRVWDHERFSWVPDPDSDPDPADSEAALLGEDEDEGEDEASGTVQHFNGYPCHSCKQPIMDCLESCRDAENAGLLPETGACCASCHHTAIKLRPAEYVERHPLVPVANMAPPASSQPPVPDGPQALESEEPVIVPANPLARRVSRCTIGGVLRYFRCVDGKEVTASEAAALEAWGENPAREIGWTHGGHA